MSTSWAMTAQAIITDAMQHCGVLESGEVPSTDDNNTCLTSLQNIIKELPFNGVSWSKVSPTPTALTWSSGTPAQVSMPADYFGVPNIYYTLNSANVDLRIITKAEYDALLQPDYVATTPISAYIAPNNIAYLWPVPSANPSLKITYQAIALDVVTTSQLDVAQAWQGGLSWLLAYEIGPKFGISGAKADAIEKRAMQKRRMMLAYSAETAPISFEVLD